MELYQTVQTNIHTQTHTNRQSVLSDFSRLPNRIYADRMLFTFLKYSAEKCLLGQKREKKNSRGKFHIIYFPFVSLLFSFLRHHLLLFRFHNILYIARIDLLIYVCMFICAGSSFASLVDNNAHIHVQCSVFMMMMMMTVPFYLFHLVLCSPCQFIVACYSDSSPLLVFQRLNNNEAKRKISSHV